MDMIEVYAEQTPNPESLKFVLNKIIHHGPPLDFRSPRSAIDSPLASELFGFPFVDSVFIASNFVTVTKRSNYGWDEIMPVIREFVKEFAASGREAVSGRQAGTGPVPESGTGNDEEVVVKIREVLEKYVRPAVEMDGGAIRFRSYKDGVVTLQLQGSCSGCPSATLTLKGGIEGMMRQMVPEVREVVAEGI